MDFEELLELHGLSIEILNELSFESHLPLSLRDDLGKVDKDALLNELKTYSNWLNEQELLSNVSIDYRIKSFESIETKYERYYPNREIRKVFNDILGLRDLCDDYQEILSVQDKRVRIVDLSRGKQDDDGYRGVHLTYRRGIQYYPIELQFNTFYDRQLNNYLHDYVYKKEYPKDIGGVLRELYEKGEIRTLDEFKEVLEDVLHFGEGHK